MKLEFFLKCYDIYFEQMEREEYKAQLILAIEKNHFTHWLFRAINLYFNDFNFNYRILDDEIKILNVYFSYNTAKKQIEMKKTLYYFYKEERLDVIYKIFEEFDSYIIFKQLLKYAKTLNELDQVTYFLYLSKVPLVFLANYFEHFSNLQKLILNTLIKRGNLEEFLYIYSQNYFIEFEIAKLICYDYSYEKIASRYNGLVRPHYEMAKKLLETFPSYYERIKQEKKTCFNDQNNRHIYIRSGFKIKPIL